MEYNLSFNPLLTIRQAPEPLRTFMSLKDSELYIIHSCLLMKMNTVSQMQRLNAKSINRSQISKGVHLSQYNSLELAKFKYQILCFDEWRHLSIENQHLTLAFRCHNMFMFTVEAEISPQGKYIGYILGTLMKQLREYSTADRAHFFQHVLKPLCRSSMQYLNIAMDESRRLRPLDQKTFISDFFDCLSPEKLKNYINNLLIPCIRSYAVVKPTLKLFNLEYLFGDDLQSIKKALPKRIQNDNHTRLLNIALGLYEILTLSSPLSEDEDPKKSLTFSISSKQAINQLDSQLSTEVLQYLIIPLLKSEWRAHETLKLFTHRCSIGSMALRELKSRLISFPKESPQKEIFKKYLHSCIEILIFDSELQSSGIKRKRTPVEGDKAPNKKVKLSFMNGKEIGRILIFEGKIFTPINEVVNEIFGCSRTTFRKCFPSPECPWPKQKAFRTRNESLKIITQGMNYFGIATEKSPEDVLQSLVERKIIKLTDH